MRPLLALVAFLVVALPRPAAPAPALTVVTVGKQAIFRPDSALVRIGKDRALAALVDPTCAGGDAFAVQLAWYPQATARLASTADVPLDCARWRKAGGRYRYEDDAGSALGIRRVDYGRKGLVMRLEGGQYVAPAGPVAYAEAWITVGERRLNARFHNFRRNTAALLVTRKSSSVAAAGEAAFWEVLHGDDNSEAREQQAIRLLTRASRIDRKDGWSPFLLGMMHLYRFGAMVDDYASVSDAALAEIRAATAAFDRGLPLVWDGQQGDSRAPGFAAAARFALGVATGDDAVTAAGLAELDAALAVNPFFNVFDLIPVVQALPRGDARFTAAVQLVLTYLNDPGTLPCVTTQPEICGNAGLAPRNMSGSLLLFGDVYAKYGDLVQAQSWYSLAGLVTAPGYRFQDVLDDRATNAPARVAAYLDPDPSNDPPVVGTGAENCATCHNR